MRKIALLLPNSVIYPSINFDMMAGLHGGLKNSNVDNVEINTENIGIAGNDRLIYAQCEKLLMSGTGIIAGYVNPTTAEKLEPLFANGDAIFIALDAGYHFPSSTKKLPHVFNISLQGALCCRIIAKMAFEDGIRKMAFTSSYYEAGYRSGYAFYKCLEDEYGTVTLNHITKLKRSEFSLEPLEIHLKNGETDGVLASFCGDMLQDFYTGLAATNAFAHHPVYGAPFMGEEQWLAKSPYPGIDIKVCVPWAGKLGNIENTQFIQQLSERKQRTNIFSVLGWEAGTLIAAALAASDTEDAIKKLEGYTFKSPRGTIQMDADTHQSYAPVYEALVQKEENTGNCKLTVGKESLLTADQRNRLEMDINNVTGSFTSWFNAYACLES